MFKFNGINHLAMITGDMDKTIRFWRDLLGMRLVVRLGRPGSRHYFFEISEKDMLAFFEWPGVAPAEEKDHGAPVKGQVIFDHISFSVENEKDLWEIKDRLSAAGFWTSEVVDHGFIHSLYSFDPNNIPIEFSHVQDETDIRKSPVVAESNSTDVAGEGSEPQKGVWPEVENLTPQSERKAYPGALNYLTGK